MHRGVAAAGDWRLADFSETTVGCMAVGRIELLFA